MRVVHWMLAGFGLGWLAGAGFGVHWQALFEGCFNPSIDINVPVILVFGGAIGLLFGLLGAAVAMSVNARKQIEGLCRRCNYNLTGLTEPRCPECGQPFEAKGDAP